MTRFDAKSVRVSWTNSSQVTSLRYLRVTNLESCCTGADADRARRSAHALLHVERPFLADGHSLELMPCIGIALFPEHCTGSETLLQRAPEAQQEDAVYATGTASS